jgi:Tol biopolymer transport system component
MKEALGKAVRIACLIFMLLTSLVVARPVSAQSATASPGVQLQAGIEKEDVEGDLKAAMEVYQKIAADPAAPRDIRARALLRLAGCDEKLGRQAKQVYEQIVHSYGDLPAAAQARAKLALIAKQEHPVLPPTMSVRQIEWAGLGQIGVNQTDGQLAVYIAADGNLYIGDLSGHARRLVYKPQPGQTIGVPGPFVPRSLWWWPSKDFSMIALDVTQPGRPDILAVVRSDGTGYRELFHLDPAEDNGFSGWSWDRRSLLHSTYSETTNTSHLWIVSVADGRRRELASAEDAYLSGEFSPDGRFVAYQANPRWTSGGATGPRIGANFNAVTGTNRIFIMPTAGGEAKLLFESEPMSFMGRYDTLMDWTADGRYLAIKDVRYGKSGLYLLPVKNGTSAGRATFIRFGDFDAAQTTATGALVYQDRATKPNGFGLYLGSVDPEGHIGNWRSVNLGGQPDLIHPSPTFSPDGRQIVYRAIRTDPNHEDLVLLDIATGKDRVIYEAPRTDLGNCLFSIKTPTLYCVNELNQQQTQFFSIDAKTGSVEQLATFKGGRSIAQPPDNDNTFLFWNLHDGLTTVLSWNRTTQQESVFMSRTSSEPAESPSNDGRWITHHENGTLSIRPITGGDSKPLFTYKQEVHPEFTMDGKWAYYTARGETGKVTLFRVPMTGGAPERVGDMPSPAGQLRIALDGRTIVTAGLAADYYDLSLLENFEPPADKK